MEVRGKEFVENMEIVREKQKLEAQANELNKQKQQTVFKSSNTKNNAHFGDTKIDDIDDIRLKDKNNNKQKYLIFGFALVLLFLITIVTIRLVSEPAKDNQFNNNDDLIETVQDDSVDSTKKKIDKSLDIDKIIQAEEDIKSATLSNSDTATNDTTKEEEKPQGDIFGIEKKSASEVKPKPKEVQQITTVTPQPVEPTPVKQQIKHDTIVKKTITQQEKIVPKEIKPQGYFIQVGAFTKGVSNSLINTLNKSHLTFIKYKMVIRGTLYTKVLVGNYKTKQDAILDLSRVKQLVRNSHAYVLRLK